jgi:hypothetical protein
MYITHCDTQCYVFSRREYMDQNLINPLSKHFRQPKLFIKLPSGGQYYKEGAIELPSNLEFPVMAMTAKDELMFKTPDALLNGQSTVSVIQSCIPNIKDGWGVPSIDIDAILIAIRIATYGETMDLEVSVPNTELERAFTIDLRMLLDQLVENEYDNIINHGSYKFEIHPSNYQSFTATAMKTFEEQRLFKTINDQEMGETEKLKLFSESFDRLTDINIDQISRSVVSVQVDKEPPVTNVEFIIEFFENTDKDVFKSVIDHLDLQKKKFVIKPFKVTTTEEDREAGAPESFEVPITFDQTNFFE